MRQPHNSPTKGRVKESGYDMSKREHLLIEDHLNCVHWTIHNYVTVNESICGLGYEDLYQEGCEALCRAAASYNEEEGAQFHTYAVSVIRNHLRDYCRRTQRQNGSTVSLDEQEATGGNRVPATWDDTSGFYVRQVLDYGKRSYRGVARLGIEALELKTAGYTVTDIARLYSVKPNQVGAWISRASKKLKKDAALVEISVPRS